MNLSLRNTFQGSLWLGLEHIVRIFSSVVLGFWIADFFGPSKFGYYSYVFVIITFLGSIIKLGFDLIAIKDLSINKSKESEILSTIFWTRVIVAISIIILILTTTLLITTKEKIIFWLISISSLLFLPFETITIKLYSESRLRQFSILRIIVNLILACFKILILIKGLHITYLYILLVIESILNAIMYTYLSRKTTSLFIPRAVIDYELLKKLWNSSKFLIISTLAVTVYMKVDQIMIKTILGDYENGIYSLCVRISEGFLFLTVIATNTFNPYFSQLFKRDSKEFDKKLKTFIRILFYLAVGISITIYFTSDFIFKDLFQNKEYLPAINVLKLYCFSLVFIFLNNSSWIWYINHNLEAFASRKLVIGAVINIVLNYSLIEKFGLNGAIFSTIISYSLVGIFFNAFSKKVRKLFWLQISAIILR
jgi:O-antigen/teichoic acid export membrane protein